MDDIGNKKLKEAVLKNWVTFFYSLMVPNAIVPILLGTIITSISFFISNPLISKLMYLTGAMLFSFGSSGIKNNYEKRMAESILIQKSKSAMRNLQSIIGHCKKISIATLSARRANRSDFKELARKVDNISTHASLGLEDWKDLVPELRNKKTTLPKARQKHSAPAYADATIPIARFCNHCSEQGNSGSHLKCPLIKIMES